MLRDVVAEQDAQDEEGDDLGPVGQRCGRVDALRVQEGGDPVQRLADLRGPPQVLVELEAEDRFTASRGRRSLAGTAVALSGIGGREQCQRLENVALADVCEHWVAVDDRLEEGPVVAESEVPGVLLIVRRVAGEGGRQQLEDVKRQASGVDLLENRRHGLLRGRLVESNHGNLIAAQRQEDVLIETLRHGASLEVRVVPCRTVVVEEPRHRTARREEGGHRHLALRVLPLGRREVQAARASEALALDSILGQRQHDLLARVDAVGARLNVDEVATSHLLAARVHRVDDASAVEALEQRGEPLLAVEQERIGVVEVCGSHPGDGRWLKADEVPTRLQRHDDAQRVTPEYRDEQLDDAFVVPLVRPLEVRQLMASLRILVSSSPMPYCWNWNDTGHIPPEPSGPRQRPALPHRRFAVPRFAEDRPSLPDRGQGAACSVVSARSRATTAPKRPSAGCPGVTPHGVVEPER